MALDLCKYYKKQRFVTYNDGLTWQPLDEYERGELYESHSSSCGAGVFQYRWNLINNGYICDGKDRYTREIYQYSEDGQVWYNVFPTVYRKGALVERDSPFCDNAGNGQYTSGDTDPTSGDTQPCPNNYEWNGYECICKGRVVNDVCTYCESAKHEHWDEATQSCVCNSQWERRNGVCVYVDPLKTIKCEDSDGILSQSEVNYYEAGWAVINYTIGDCINTIGDSAFNGQIFMINVEIPSTVTQVGNLAFANCRSLETITFPSSLTTLGANVFLGCTNLKYATFEGSVPSVVSAGLFSQCDNLESASWLQYNNITQIGNRAFFNCYKLQNVVLPNTLTLIGDAVFYGCRSLASINIPSGVTNIGEGAFSKCVSLANININSNNIYLGQGAFNECTSLTVVTINSSGMTVGNNVFNGCTSLLRMIFTSPEPFEITEGFFDNTNECALIVPCENIDEYRTAWSEYEDRIQCFENGVYYRWVSDNGVYCEGTDAYTRQKQQQSTDGITWVDNGVYKPISFITHYSKECGYQGDTVLTITNTEGYHEYYEPCQADPVPSQNSKLFAVYNYGDVYEDLCDGNATLNSGSTHPNGYSINDMTSAIIGDCVTTIGDEAFKQAWGGNTKLDTIVLPSGLTTIGSSAFEYCSSLTSINIPNSVTSISQNVFEGCSGLTNINIPSGVTSISNGCFADCYGLTNINIHSGITSIGNSSFSNCHNLKNIEIPSSVTSIGSSAFYNCYGLTNVSINTSSVGNWFSGITSITSVTLGNNVTSIGENAFYNCSGLTNIVIPNNVTTIGNSSFRGCSGLTSINIPSGVTSLGNSVFYNCGSLTNIEIPDGVTNLGEYMFYGCTNLANVIIGTGITSINVNAFYSCNCSSLESITIKATTPPTVNQYTFATEKTYDCPIYVPAQSVQTYKTASGWTTYSSRIQAIPN